MTTADFYYTGIVTEAKGRKATVLITPGGPCPDSHEGCPAKVLAESGKFTVEAENPITALPGQKVTVEVESPHYYRSLFIVFVLPLILLFVGYLAGVLIAKLMHKKEEEPLAYVFMVLGFLSSFLVMAACGKKYRAVYKIIGPAGAGESGCWMSEMEK